MRAPSEQTADSVVRVSNPDECTLPGLVGRIARASLKYHGFYSYTDADGQKVLVKLETSK